MLCPLLERMLDKAMKERHWKRIEEVTKWNFDFESEGFLLRNVMEAPLLKNVEDIEVRQDTLNFFLFCQLNFFSSRISASVL